MTRVTVATMRVRFRLLAFASKPVNWLSLQEKFSSSSTKKPSSDNMWKFKKKNMKKELVMDGDTARKLYPTASSEFKQMLEESFGKEFFSQKITDKISNYSDVLAILGFVESVDEMNIKGLDCQEQKVAQALIKKLRICKAYNEGWLPKRGEKRWFPYWAVSSGFGFGGSDYVCDHAYTFSASHLCFKTKEISDDYAKKFADVEKTIIDLE